jgi:hypothetical protein
MAHGHYAKTLPNDLSAPAFVNAWRTRALIVGAVFAVLGIVLALLANSQGDKWNHFFRAWLLGLMICFGFSIGGMCVLMVQYCSGGKWGLLIRRPLEAMTRTLPLVVLYFLPIGIMAKKLYLWAQYPDAEDALKQGLINQAQAHAIAFKKPMLNEHAFWAASIVCFLIWGFYAFKLNRWSLQRDADSSPNVPYWQTKFENLSGFGIVVARPHLVLDRLWAAVPGRTGLRRAGAGDPHRCWPLQGRAIQDRPSHHRATRPGQAGLRLRDAQYVSRFRAVPHHLVGQSAGGD